MLVGVRWTAPPGCIVRAWCVRIGLHAIGVGTGVGAAINDSAVTIDKLADQGTSLAGKNRLQFFRQDGDYHFTAAHRDRGNGGPQGDLCQVVTEIQKGGRGGVLQIEQPAGEQADSKSKKAISGRRHRIKNINDKAARCSP